jgi:hypothetical protein
MFNFKKRISDSPIWYKTWKFNSCQLLQAAALIKETTLLAQELELTRMKTIEIGKRQCKATIMAKGSANNST